MALTLFAGLYTTVTNECWWHEFLINLALQRSNCAMKMPSEQPRIFIPIRKCDQPRIQNQCGHEWINHKIVITYCTNQSHDTSALQIVSLWVTMNWNCSITTPVQYHTQSMPTPVDLNMPWKSRGKRCTSWNSARAISVIVLASSTRRNELFPASKSELFTADNITPGNVG